MGKRMMKMASLLMLMLMYGSVSSVSQETAWGQWKSWGDQGNGTYLNPILPCDLSDIDCIKVGKRYYAISSTFQFSPGMIILESEDLVNWDIAGHAVDDITQISPELNWDRMNRYGRGIWAGTIRHHKGRFYIMFGTPEEGYFMTSSKSAKGPWTPLVKVLDEPGWDDCTFLWDDEGNGWFAGTHFADGYKTYIYKMSRECDKIDWTSGLLVNEGSGREASKLIKVGKWYYLVFSEHKNGKGRYVMAKRSEKIDGPYNEERILTRNLSGTMEPNQGGIVEGPDKKWYFLTHHGTGDWEGRCLSLLPVTWEDGWPIPGKMESDGIGVMEWMGKVPAKKKSRMISTSEDFNGTTLSEALEWNYQPRKEMYSLTERKGWLRLKAFPSIGNKGLMGAGNTLTERSLRTYKNTVTTKIDVSGMADGQISGLCHFSAENSSIGIRQENGKRRIEANINGKVYNGEMLDNDEIWLRSAWGQDGISIYSYSTNGKDFIPFGEPYQLRWGNYRGDRIGIFTYNDNGEHGYSDFDYLHYEYDKDSQHSKGENMFGNALVADMIADASIQIINGTYYCNATTDGYGQGLDTSGPPTLWKSTDFKNWSFNGTIIPTASKNKYWAPSKIVEYGGRYYLYPTIDGEMYAMVADNPEGPYDYLGRNGQKGDKATSKILREKEWGIDAEIFIDDDGKKYIFWNNRHVARLHDDMVTIDSTYTVLPSKHNVYSEGPIFFKRNGIYYYLYTLGGDERYQYAYMMSKESPMGPYETPENDIIATTDYANGVYGPGHGCVFENTDGQYYFAFLEFGRRSTNRQTYVSKMDFNSDGTISPISLNLNGTGSLNGNAADNLIQPKAAAASSVKSPELIEPMKDPLCRRTEYFNPEFAYDGMNGSRWMAGDDDPTPSLTIDLGKKTEIKRSELYFVRPTAGHAYKLEVSNDCKKWTICGGHDNARKQSPHTDDINGKYRYLRVTITEGVKGIWEWRVKRME